MQVTNIYYEKAFPLAPYLNEKVGITIALLPGESEDDAIFVAKKFVNNWGNKLVEQERAPVTQYFATAPGPQQSAKEDQEFKDLKDHLVTIVYREDAEEYVKTTSFKHSLEAKALVQLKPLRDG